MSTSTTPCHVTPSFISSRLKVAECLHPLCTTDCVCLHIELVSEDSLSQVMLTHSLLKLGWNRVHTQAPCPQGLAVVALLTSRYLRLHDLLCTQRGCTGQVHCHCQHNGGDQGAREGNQTSPGALGTNWAEVSARFVYASSHPGPPGFMVNWTLENSERSCQLFPASMPGLWVSGPAVRGVSAPLLTEFSLPSRFVSISDLLVPKDLGTESQVSGYLKRIITRLHWAMSPDKSQVSVIFISRSLYPVPMMQQLTLRRPVMTLRTSIRGWRDLSLTLRKWSARKMTSMGKINSSTCYHLIRTNLKFGKWCILYEISIVRLAFVIKTERLQNTVPVNIPPLSNIMY